MSVHCKCGVLVDDCAQCPTGSEQIPTPPAPLTLHVPVWPISEAPKDRQLMLYPWSALHAWHRGYWDPKRKAWRFTGLPGVANPTHFTELKYMALPDSTGGDEQ